MACTGVLWAQTAKPSFILNNNETGSTRSYVARNFISLKTNFRYTGIPGHSFIAKIDATLAFTIVSIPNPAPGDISGSQQDGTYTPGGSFGSDPIQQIQGLPTVIQKTIGSVVVNETSYTYPVLWFKTVPVTNNLNGEYRWMDITTNPTTLKKYNFQGTGTEYKLTRDKLRTYNFNPAMDLTYDNVSKEVLLKKSNLAQATIIGVWGAKDEFKTDKFMFAVKGRLNDSVLFSKKSLAHIDVNKSDLAYGSQTTRNFLYRTGTVEGADTNKYHERSLRIGTFYKANKPNNTVWGEPQKAIIALGSKFDTTVVKNITKFNSQWTNMDGFKGFTPELLVFDRQLSALECSKFETYLAIKYGLTLDKSYISANGSVVWNYATDTTYNNRITGYGREDAMGLNQKMATTSYEETPYFSELLQNDSYDSSNSYNLSSRNRLLVMGCQPGNILDNGKYVIFGDNKDSIKTTNGLIAGFTAAMSRKWLVCTNLYQSPETDKVLNSVNTGLSIINKSNFKSDIFKVGSMSIASVVTTDTLKGKDGYFAWTVEQEYGPITIKFGTNLAVLTSNSHDYGYKIAIDGQVHSIQKGIENAYSLFNVEKGQRLEIEKNGRVMSLRVNGIRNKNTEFLIDSTDYQKTNYGALSIGSNAFDIKLTDFRHGGFVDTGNKVELSYINQRASAFANYKIGKTYLIVDRLNGIIDTIPCDEVDESRSKIIFNNVFWDTDRNGRDAFTFGYISSGPLLVKKSGEPEQTPEPDIKGVNDIRIYYNDINDLSTVTVKVKTEKPSPVIILTYDVSGRRIERQDLPESKEVQFTEIKLPGTGLYIVKVITNKMEYSQKVISKK